MQASTRLRLEIHGAVQGVGFRPFVFRLAEELALGGWVVNDARGLFLEVEGPRQRVDRFRARLRRDSPRHARVDSLSEVWLAPAGFTGFEIRPSEAAGAKQALVLPDLATCDDCLREVLDPADRRHRYPFANCTRCGPRFTILRALPYDRANTTMRDFPLCPACRREYGDRRDRRFHAQPVACPACGPALALWSLAGETLARGDDALAAAAGRLAAGEIVAVKGLGGFHLMLDARDDAAVARLRERKRREMKPLALMVRDLAMARALCEVTDEAARALGGPEAPILLLPRRAGAPVAAGVAPANPRLGLMLPAAPLHHLLARACDFPLVATSGNRREEPICTDEREALERLGGLADAFLVHDRPIERPVDDSVATILRGKLRLLRRARGFAPLPVPLPRAVPTILAVGGQLKSAVALSVADQALVSQHLGDLETPQAQAAFERAIADLLTLYEARPVGVAHDLHPDYVSTRWAIAAASRAADGDAPPRAVAVQHHHAHLAACLAEHPHAPRALGVIWDGTGYGPDGTVWGGEFLLGDATGFTRVAHLRPFRLAGGEAAVREPRRVALALLWERFGPGALERDDLDVVRSFAPPERRVLARMLERGVNAPLTTSVGRLFDGVAALVGFGGRVTFEGEAAMGLEWAADPDERGAYPLPVVPGAEGGAATLDWGPMLDELLGDLARGVARGTVAARFHAALIAAALEVAARVGERHVALSGGCFQNRLLVERLAEGLEARGHEPLLHERVPPNDGGLALGQLAVAAASLGMG